MMKDIFTLSPQAVGSIMLAMQNSIRNVMIGKPPEECDVSLMLKGFEMENTPMGLVVINPPMLDYTNEEQEETFQEVLTEEMDAEE